MQAIYKNFAFCVLESKQDLIHCNVTLKVVSQWTGIPVNTLDRDEKEKLMHLADRLRERVAGQDAAVNLVAQAVLRSRAGLDQPECQSNQ